MTADITEMGNPAISQTPEGIFFLTYTKPIESFPVGKKYWSVENANRACTHAGAIRDYSHANWSDLQTRHYFGDILGSKPRIVETS